MTRCAVCSGALRGRSAQLPDGRRAHAICASTGRYRPKHHRRAGEELPAEPIEPLTAADHAALATRPKTWGECRDRVGPCPWISCRYHLALEVTPTGRIVLTDSSVPPDEMAEPCALRLAERGEQDGPEVARRLGVSRQRVQQIEARAFRVLRRAGRQDG